MKRDEIKKFFIVDATKDHGRKNNSAYNAIHEMLHMKRKYASKSGVNYETFPEVEIQYWDEELREKCLYGELSYANYKSKDLIAISERLENDRENVLSDLPVFYTIEGNKTISLGNAVAGELIELHIYGNNDVFSSLKIGDDVVLSDDLYLFGDSIIVIKDSKGNSKEYELGIKDVLRQKDGVYDEYVLKDGKAQIIRRINLDGTIKTKETIEDLGAFSIELFDGTNTLLIKNYTASLKAKFAIQNDMTNIYASKVEMNSAINQTAEQVDINVNKKLESYSKTTEMNAAIDVKAEEINQKVKKKVGEDEIISKINQSAEKVRN